MLPITCNSVVHDISPTILTSSVLTAGTNSFFLWSTNNVRMNCTSMSGNAIKKVTNRYKSLTPYNREKTVEDEMK